MAITRIRNNQVYNSDINAQYKLQPYSVTGALLSNNFTYTGNMVVGNLTVNGVTTTVDTTNLVIADPLFAINRNQSGTPSYDLGMVMGRGNQNNVALIWEEGAQQFQLQYTSESTAATTFGTINNSGYANLQAYGIKLNNATITTTNITNFIASNVSITGGYIDGVAIGANTPNSGVFTTLTTSSGGQIKAYFNGPIGANGGNTGAFTTLTAATIGNSGAQIYGANIAITGNALIQNGLALNSNATITTDQTTATLFNTTTTTINAYGAATLINYGSTSGAINFKNPNIYSSATSLAAFDTTPTSIVMGNAATLFTLGATGAASALVLNGANIYSPASTVYAFDTTPTSIVLGNAATSISIGATTGTTTVFNTVAAPTVNAGTIGNVGASITGTTGSFNTVSAGVVGNSGALLQGTIVSASAAQPNITSVGTLTSLNTSGNISVGTANVYAAYVVANTALVGTLATNSQPYITSVGTLTSLSSTGTISANQVQAGVIGNSGALLNGTLVSAAAAQPNITSVGTLTSLNTSGNISAGTANVYAAYVVANTGVSGLVLTNSQPYITSVGTLTSLSTSGTISASAVNAGTIGNSGASIYGGNIAITGNALIQNGLALNSNATLTTNQTTASLFNTTATTVNLGGAATAINMGASGAGVVTINSTGNSYGSGQGALQIAGGFYAAGDSYIAGNLVVANINSTSYNALVANAPLLYLSANSVTNYNYEIGFYSHKYDAIEGYNHTGFVRNHSDNAWYVFSNIRTEPGATVDLGNANIIYDTVKLGNLIAYSGNTSTSATTGALVVYGGAGIQGNIYGYAIQNTPIGNGIASTGAFTTLSTTGTITSGANITAQTANAYASYIVANSGLQGTLITNAQNNITSVGTLTSLNSSGNITAQTANVYAAYVVANSGLQGTLITNAQTNITSVGTLTSLTTSGVINSTNSNITAGTANVYAAYVVANTALSTPSIVSSGNITATTANVYAAWLVANTGVQGLVTTNSQPYITSVGTLSSLSVSGASTLTGTVTAGGQVIGYFNGIVGANAANSATFTTANVNGTLYTATVQGATIGNSGANFTGASETLTGNSTAANYNSSGTITINNMIANSGTGTYSTGAGALIVKGGAGVSGNVNAGQLQVGQIGYSDINVLIMAQSSTNGYNQIISQNTNNGSSASADIIVSNDQGTASTYYGDFGINSSQYSGSGSFNAPNNVYLASASSDLAIGTLGSNAIRFFVNTGATDSLIVNTNGNITIPTTTTSTSTTTGALVVGGGVGITGNINIGANSYVGVAHNTPSIYVSNINPYANSGNITLYTPVNTNVTVNGNQLAANLIVHGNGAAGYQNLLVTNGLTGQVAIKAAPSSITGNVSFMINSTDSMMVPVGATAARPSNATAGMVRFNNQTSQLEFYSGTAWQGTGSTFTTISAQQFTGDGTTTVFTLSQSATTASTVVAINGVVQIPTTAYTVSGTSLTFTEAPLSTDIIDARVVATTSIAAAISDGSGANSFVGNTAGSYITAVNTVSLLANSSGNFFGTSGISTLNPNVSLSAGVPTIIDSFNINVYRGAKYVYSVSDYGNYNFQLGEAIVVVGNANATIQNFGIVTANGVSMTTLYANVSGTTARIYANAGVASYAKVQQIYMPL